MTTFAEMLDLKLRLAAHRKHPDIVDNDAYQKYLERLREKLAEELVRAAVEFCKPWPSEAVNFKLK